MRELFLEFGVALALGLLVGFQRERTKGALGGIRTFPLIALAGASCGYLGRSFGIGAMVPAGLVAVAALVVLGSLIDWKKNDAGGSGITTEVAALAVFLVGAVATVGPLPLAVVLGGTVATLLHFKRSMHGLAHRLNDDEMRALMRIVVIALVILPLLPNETYGPYDVLNPFQIWLMVVLIVGISVASYILYRVVSARAGAVVGGILGGLISSTATTASYARQTRDAPRILQSASAVIMIASTVVFARVFVEVAVVAPNIVPRIAAPLLLVAGVNLVLCGVCLLRLRGAAAGLAETEHDPARMQAALVFGGLYGAILFAVAAAKQHFGDIGLYLVATASGLTDVDAITLSIANLAEAGRVDTATAWRAILIALQANLAFKGALAFGLGGRALARSLAPLFGISLAAGAAVLVLWP